MKEEGEAQTVCNEVTAAPIPHSQSFYSTGDEEMEKVASEAEPRKKGMMGGTCFRILILFPNPKFI